MRLFLIGLILIVLQVQLYCVTGKDVVCGFPGTPASGYVKPDLEAYREGDVVSYSCRVGYILLGSPISRCKEDGSWTEDVPICDDSMTTLGVAFSTPTVPGNAAEMAIDRDKGTCTYLKPKKPRWWRIDLGDTYKVLSVAVTMKQSDEPVKFTIFVIKTQDGSASYKRCASFTGKFGTQTVVMSCADGKGIVGEKVHIEDHIQTEDLFEICEVEVQVEKDTGYDCGRPSRNLYSITLAPRYNRVDYGCVRGYRVEGESTRTCLSTGQWSGEPPICEPIVCEELEDLENGQITLTPENGPPLEGTTAIFTCIEGYRLKESSSFTRICLKDGSWSGKAPQCKAIRCPVPDGEELNGIYRLLNKTTGMRSVAQLRCKRGKIQGDNPYITCTDQGTWTPPEARCVLPAGTASERSEKREEPAIANKGAVIFGMIVAAIMIVVVLVAVYLKTQKQRDEAGPKLPSRLSDPPVPPPRPPPRSNEGGIRSAIMGFLSRDSPEKPDDEVELTNSWQKSSDPVVQVEHPPPGESKRTVYPVPEENESSLKESSVKDEVSVDSSKKKRSRPLKEQDSVDSSSTAAASPLPPDESTKEISRSPTPPNEESENAASEEESDESEKRRVEEERKAKEEEERAKEEAEKKAKEEEEKKAKEAEEKKENEARAPGRRRRARDEPPPVEEEKPVVRRLRRFQ